MNCYNDMRLHEHLADLDRCEREAQAEDDAIAAMMASRSQIDDFLAYTGTDVATLLARLLTQGIPSRDGADGDNKHMETIVDELDRLREEFEAYARKPVNRASPLKVWMQNREDDAL